MAKTAVISPPSYVGLLETALQRIAADAKVSIEHIRANRYRFIVISKKFSEMSHPQRQRLVWSIADKVVPPADLLDVGMILTIAPSEL